jgi:hypothetical protein
MSRRLVFGRLLIALVVVTSMVAVPIAPAAADSVTDECTELDEFVHVLTIGQVNKDSCDPSKQSATIQKMQENETLEDKIAIYQSATELQESGESFNTVLSNYGQDTTTIAWGKGEAAAINAVENNSDLQATQAAANDSIEEYYSIKQQNFLNNWNSQAQDWKYLIERSDVNGDIPDQFVAPRYYDQTDPWRYVDVENHTATLANGTTVEMKRFALEFRDQSEGSWYGTYYIDPVSGPTSAPSGAGIGERAGDQSDGLVVQSFNQYPEMNPALDIGSWESQWSSLQSRSTDLKSNIQSYVENLYYDYREDDLGLGSENKTANYISPSTLAQEFSLNYNASQSEAYAWAYAAQAGYQTPNLNQTSGMTITYNSTTYDGILFADSNPNNNSWVAGYSYNSSDISGDERFITDTGQVLTLNGSFTINEIRSSDGGTINETTVQQYYYKTSNTSEFEDLQQRLQDLSLQIEEYENSPGAGSGGGIGFGPGALGGREVLIILLVAVLAGTALAN